MPELTRRAAIVVTAATTVGAALASPAPPTEAQHYARGLLLGRIERTERIAAQIAFEAEEGLASAEEGDAFGLLYSMAHDDAVRELAAFDRGEGVWARLSRGEPLT